MDQTSTLTHSNHLILALASDVLIYRIFSELSIRDVFRLCLTNKATHEFVMGHEELWLMLTKRTLGEYGVPWHTWALDSMSAEQLRTLVWQRPRVPDILRNKEAMKQTVCRVSKTKDCISQACLLVPGARWAVNASGTMFDSGTLTGTINIWDLDIDPAEASQGGQIGEITPIIEIAGVKIVGGLAVHGIRGGKGFRIFWFEKPDTWQGDFALHIAEYSTREQYVKRRMVRVKGRNRRLRRPHVTGNLVALLQNNENYFTVHDWTTGDLAVIDHPQIRNSRSLIHCSSEAVVFWLPEEGQLSCFTLEHGQPFKMDRLGDERQKLADIPLWSIEIDYTLRQAGDNSRFPTAVVTDNWLADGTCSALFTGRLCCIVVKIHVPTTKPVWTLFKVDVSDGNAALRGSYKLVPTFGKDLLAVNLDESFDDRILLLDPSIKGRYTDKKVAQGLKYSKIESVDYCPYSRIESNGGGFKVVHPIDICAITGSMIAWTTENQVCVWRLHNVSFPGHQTGVKVARIHGIGTDCTKEAEDDDDNEAGNEGSD